MTADRIKEIQCKTAYPNSVSVSQALLQVWNECSTSSKTERMYSEEEVLELLLKSKIETSNLYYEDMKEWFKTYGSKGSDDHIVDTNEMVSSQTEISDEEI